MNFYVPGTIQSQVIRDAFVVSTISLHKYCGAFFILDFLVPSIGTIFCRPFL